MSCPVGWPSALAEVLWEEYGMKIKFVLKVVLFLFLAAANMVLWKLI